MAGLPAVPANVALVIERLGAASASNRNRLIRLPTSCVSMAEGSWW
jgi:hypothetical protein